MTRACIGVVERVLLLALYIDEGLQFSFFSQTWISTGTICLVTTDGSLKFLKSMFLEIFILFFQFFNFSFNLFVYYF